MNWIDITDRLPEPYQEVLLHVAAQKPYRILGEYVRANERQIDTDYDCFDGLGDFWPEGWYESPTINGSDDEPYWSVDLGKVTHWMPLPAGPEVEEWTLSKRLSRYSLPHGCASASRLGG